MSTGLIDQALGYVADHAWNGYGNLVDITSYISTNKYTVPSDGMVRVWSNYRAGNYIQITISNSDGTNALEFHQASAGGAHSSTAVPVFKGQKIWTINNNGLYNYVTFVPFANYNT